MKIRTQKSTQLAVHLYNTVMMYYSTQIGSTFVPLHDTSEDVLADNISSFFMILRKKDGSFYNASSLGTFYQSLSRYLSKREPPIDKKMIFGSDVFETLLA